MSEVIGAEGSAGPSSYISVLGYGASDAANFSAASNAAAIAKAIAGAIAMDAAGISFPAIATSRYHVAPNGAGSIILQQSGSLTDFTLDLMGSTLVMDWSGQANPSTMISAYNWDRLKIRNGKIDIYPNIFAQGVITNIAGDNSHFDFLLDSADFTPNFASIDSIFLHDDTLGVDALVNWSGVVYNPVWTLAPTPGGPALSYRVTPTGGKTVLDAFTNKNTAYQLEVGSHLSVCYKKSNGRWLVAQGNQKTFLEDIEVLASNGGPNIGKGGSLFARRLKALRKTGWLMNTPTDFFHSEFLRGTVDIDDVMLEGMGDDMLNFTVANWGITASDAESVTSLFDDAVPISGNAIARIPQEGDIIAFKDPTMVIQARLPASSITPLGASSYQIGFGEDIPGGFNRATWAITNLSDGPQKTRVSRFHTFASMGRYLFHGNEIMFTDSSASGCFNGGVAILDPEGTVFNTEGANVGDIHLQNLRFKNVGKNFFAQQGIATINVNIGAPATDAPLAAPGYPKRLFIGDVTLEGSGFCGINIQGISEVGVEGPIEMSNCGSERANMDPPPGDNSVAGNDVYLNALPEAYGSAFIARLRMTDRQGTIYIADSSAVTFDPSTMANFAITPPQPSANPPAPTIEITAVINFDITQTANETYVVDTAEILANRDTALLGAPVDGQAVVISRPGTATGFSRLVYAERVGIVYSGLICSIPDNWKARLVYSEGLAAWYVASMSPCSVGVPVIDLANGNANFTPGQPLTIMLDDIDIGADRNHALLAANAVPGMQIYVSRAGSSGGHNRNFYLDTGYTELIKAVADGFVCRFVFDDDLTIRVTEYFQSS